MNTPDPILCSTFVFLSFVMAGTAQTVWLKSAYSKRIAIAIDGGRSFRGRRIFGDNKTLRGFVVMIPAAGVSFVIARSVLATFNESSSGLWTLSAGAYLLLGGWAGFGFMLGELPNSFIKRQWDIAPGAAPMHPFARVCCFIVDQVDSIFGGLFAVSILVPVPLWSWIYVLLIGAIIHWGFNCVFALVGLKTRAA